MSTTTASAKQCRHEESLYGRCTRCGMTWDEQSRAAGGVTPMRCLVDGRWMRRLVPGGHWWMCSNGCKELRSSNPDVEFGWQLMAGRKMMYGKTRR